MVSKGLRASDDDFSNIPVPGLQCFWQYAEKPPIYEWEQWNHLFEVAVLARRSVSQLSREADQNHYRVPAMMENLEEEPAKRKVTSLLKISIGNTGR